MGKFSGLIFPHPSFSFTNVKMAVATLTTVKVAIARQMASDFVNSHIARMHRTVHAISDEVITRNAIHRTRRGSTTPLIRRCGSTVRADLSISIL
jgi:hypothetical protein